MVAVVIAIEPVRDKVRLFYVWAAVVCAASAPHLPDTDHSPWHVRMVGLEISRFPCEERACVPGSQTPPGHGGACDDAPPRIAFRE
jgi:hypothetical protein